MAWVSYGANNLPQKGVVSGSNFDLIFTNAAKFSHDFYKRWLEFPLQVAVAVFVFMAIFFPEYLPFYSKEKSDLAENALKIYKDTKVHESLDVQEKNLETLLKAEIEALNESAALRLDIALTRISSDRPVPSGQTSLAAWYETAGNEVAALGFPASTSLLAYLDGTIDVGNARRQIDLIKARLGESGSAAVKALPNCASVLVVDPETATWAFADRPENAAQRDFLMHDFAQYVTECQVAAAVNNGRVGIAFLDLNLALDELSQRRRKAKALTAEIKKMAKEVKNAQAEDRKRQKAIADFQKTLDKRTDELKDIADGVASVAKELRNLTGADGEAEIAEKAIGAITTVLGAVGSGQVASDGKQTALSADLATATAWLRSNVFPLADDMAELIDQAKAPPVSNLILELEHQKARRNYAKARIGLAESRIELLRLRFNTLIDAARAWRGFRLALCNYATLSAGIGRFGPRCHDFAAAVKPKDADGGTTVACTFTDDRTAVEPCVLGKTWRQALDDAESARDDDGRARKRELYSALYQYAEAFEAERASRELQFRLADVDHRKMLASQRSSIDTWNNSVAFLLGLGRVKTVGRVRL